MTPLNTSDVLDLSKENVQPLRQGRKAAHLKTALQAQTDPETMYKLQKQREKFENMIRMYEGDDPLEPYCNYVAWLEQSFTKLGRESNLIPVIEDALLKYKDCEKYKQDPRFVQLLVKYISAQSNPLELYQLSYNQGLGTMCSAFYKAWAEELDKSNDYKRADQIYQLGIQCRAQPFRELEDAHIQFQLSIARKMLEGNIMNSDQGTENTRIALSKLQPSKVKTSRLSKDTAGVFQQTSRNLDTKNNAVSVGKFKVYQEDESDGFAKSDFKNKTEKLPKGSLADRENVMKPAKWTGQKQKQSAAFRSSMPTTPSFQVHEDPLAACDNIKTTLRPRALKVRREEFKCPVAVFEEPDPSRKPMYPKHLVYVGGRDIQLEELRAASYLKKIEKEEQEKLEQLEKLKKAPQVPPIEPKTPVTKPVELPMRLSETKTEQIHSSNEAWRKNESTEADPANISEKNLLPPLCSPSTSFTVNTRAAMNVIQQMWSSPLVPASARRQNPTDFDDSLFKVPLQPIKISVDLNKENTKPSLMFPIFCDDDNDAPPSPTLDPENKENCPPETYTTPTEKRPLSGILTPATNVLFKELDSEESEDDEEYCQVIPRTENDFDEETCSTKAFAITLPSSTPFARPQGPMSRKSLLYNGSYIENKSNGQQLSLILENSKEQGSNSSGSGSSARR